MAVEDSLLQKHSGASCTNISTRARLVPKGKRRHPDGVSQADRSYNRVGAAHIAWQFSRKPRVGLILTIKNYLRPILPP